MFAILMRVRIPILILPTIVARHKQQTKPPVAVDFTDGAAPTAAPRGGGDVDGELVALVEDRREAGRLNPEPQPTRHWPPARAVSHRVADAGHPPQAHLWYIQRPAASPIGP